MEESSEEKEANQDAPQEAELNSLHNNPFWEDCLCMFLQTYSDQQKIKRHLKRLAFG